MSHVSRAALVLFIALGSGASFACGTYKPARSYEVGARGDARAAYGATLDVLASKNYKLVSKDDGTRQVRVVSHADEQSFIDLHVGDDGKVALTPTGKLVHSDGSTHKRLRSEVLALETEIDGRLGRAGGPANPQPVAAATDTKAPAPAGVPVAWSEPAYDPAVWGPGDFTCVPVKVPAEDAPLLRLKLSTGEDADVALSIAYAPELCRSPKQCSLSGGCPALGLGDPGQVSRLADRLQRKEIGAQATLTDRGKPVAIVDLSRHGSIAQSLAQHKK